MKDDDNGTIQLNIAGLQRISGGDYYEFRCFAPWMLVWLLSDEELDRRSLENSNLFRYRFGFLPNEETQATVVAFRKQYRMADKEFRCYHRTGQLVVTETKVTVKPNRYLPVAGWFVFTVITLLMLSGIIAYHSPSGLQADQSLGQVLCASVWLVMVLVTRVIFMDPSYKLKQLGLY